MKNTIKFNSDYPEIKQSDYLYEKAKDLIPGASQTLAKGPSQYVKGIAPKYLESGKGCYVTDVDGNEFLDYNMGIGPIVLGYSYPQVDEQIVKQLVKGITFSMMHPLEVEVATLINKVIPNAESVRFSKTGADVASAAIRLARAYTGKNKVLCCGYHGWHDWYIGVTNRNAGIPAEIQDLTFTFDYNNKQSVIDSIDSDTACIILEPFVFTEPKDGFLQFLRDICNHYGCLLIFDEMWTGFRISAGGAQEYFGVEADLACFSKAIANGMPISVLTGKKEIMDLLDNDVFFYTTFGGETLSLAAAKETINIIVNENVPAYLDKLGEHLKSGIHKIFSEIGISYINCIGYNCRTMLTFNEDIVDGLLVKSIIQQELIKNGIIWSGNHNLSYSHSLLDIQYTLTVYEKVLRLIHNAFLSNSLFQLLKGEKLTPVFRKVSNFNMKPNYRHVDSDFVLDKVRN